MSSSSPATLAQIAYHFVRAQWAFSHLRGAALTEYQNRRARRIVYMAALRSPFYRAHWSGCDLQDWQRLPLVDKRRMMADFAAFNTRGTSLEAAMGAALRAEASRDFAPTLDGLTVGLSSGTSGHRGLFLVSPAEMAAWAGTILARTLHRLPPAGYRIAFFLRSNSNLYEGVGASRRIVFRWFDLMTPVLEAVAALNVYAPHLLVGPPSLLLMLADACERGLLRARPQRLVSVAEVLEPQDRQRLEAVFGVAVHQVYQCTEGLLGATCPAGHLHVQEDLVALQYDPLSPNDPERVTPIVTDLWRTTQPILRYRLGDVLRLVPADMPPCSCGSVFQRIESIEGRSDDVCWFVSAAESDVSPTLRPFFPDTIRRMALLADSRITDYAAVQEHPGHLRLFLEVSEGAPFAAVADAALASVARTVEEYGCRPARIEIECGLPPAVGGAKRRRVRCLHKP